MSTLGCKADAKVGKSDVSYWPKADIVLPPYRRYPLKYLKVGLQVS